MGIWKNQEYELGADGEIAAQKFNLEFQPLDSPFILLSYEIDPGLDLAWGMDMGCNDESNILIVTWNDYRLDDGSMDIFGHLFNTEGESFGPSLIINEAHQSLNVYNSGWSKSLVNYGESFLFPYIVENTDISKWDLYLIIISIEEGEVINESIFVTQLDSLYYSHQFDLCVNNYGQGALMWSTVDYEFPSFNSASISGILIERGLEFQQEILEFIPTDTTFSCKYIRSLSMNDDYLVYSYADGINNESYALKVAVVDLDSLFTDLEVNKTPIPEVFSFYTYPNPFNDHLTIKISLPHRSTVNIRLVNILSEEVRQFLSENLGEGVHHLSWDGKNNFGKSVPSGIYFVVANSNNQVKVEKITFLK